MTHQTTIRDSAVSKCERCLSAITGCSKNPANCGAMEPINYESVQRTESGHGFGGVSGRLAHGKAYKHRQNGQR